ncbi:hypothetical protein ENBRE01_0460 [Enteropsectra breve]|nr:hypothetical protein ENBRE01_0460 [Enteropsectra breve]
MLKYDVMKKIFQVFFNFQVAVTFKVHFFVLRIKNSELSAECAISSDDNTLVYYGEYHYLDLTANDVKRLLHNIIISNIYLRDDYLAIIRLIYKDKHRSGYFFTVV